MMNIVIRNQQKSECFSCIFQHIKLFCEHINIMFEKERMYIQSMDSARVSIFEISIPSTWFDVYEHNKPGTMLIGVSSTLLYKILNTRDKIQDTNIIFNTDDSDKLFINFVCENKTIFDKHFEIPLIDLDTDILGIPEFDSQAEFSIQSITFASIISQLKLFSDTIDINCTEEKIILESNSVESGKMTVDINIDDLTSFSINEGETLRLSFSLALLHNICMFNKIAKDMEIHLTDNYPMKIIYYLGDEHTKITFYLAPKINDNE